MKTDFFPTCVSTIVGWRNLDFSGTPWEKLDGNYTNILQASVFKTEAARSFTFDLKRQAT